METIYLIRYKGAYLHSDEKFYHAFIYMRGCYPKIYKRKSAAIRKAMRYKDVEIETKTYFKNDTQPSNN